MGLFSSRRRQSYSAILQIDSHEVTVKRSARRRKSISIKIERDGEVVVMAPMQTRDAQIRQIVLHRSEWIHKQQQILAAEKIAERQYLTGETIWFLGQRLELRFVIGDTAHISVNSNTLLMTHKATQSNQATRERLLTRWLRQQAQNILTERTEALAKDLRSQLNKQPTAIEVKSYKARWGSCTQLGKIQLNWRLIMAPMEVIDYVIIHELCHLKFFNHSPGFWAEVAQACPEFKTHRQWLKSNSRQLSLD